MEEPARIPNHPLELRHNSSGMAGVGLYQRGRIYQQRSSRGQLWFCAALAVAAGVFACLPWQTPANHGMLLKHWVSLGLLWGVICVAIAYWLRNLLGQRITIDPHAQTLTIQAHGIHRSIAWCDILGLQWCHQKNPTDPEMNGYQLILITG